MLKAGEGKEVGLGAGSRMRCRAGSFGHFGPESRQTLDDGKYTTDGELQIILPGVQKAPTISQHGNVGAIIGKFGGADKLRNAVHQLQSLLYAAYRNRRKERKT